MKKTIIIGGGAAGLMAACMLGREGVDVLLVEKQARVGRKLLSTGNGRCNLSNLNANAKHYHGDARFVSTVLNAFTPKDTIAMFESLGVPCVHDEEGRVYPMSNQAASVLDALRLYAAENGVKMITENGVTGLKKTGSGYRAILTDGSAVSADFALVACGGLAAPKLGGCADGYKLLSGLGHTISPRLPAIVSLKTEPDRVRALKGIRVHCALTLRETGHREYGELLFSDGGLSGICAMQLAREVNLLLQKNKRCSVSVCLYPDGGDDPAGRLIRALPERAAEDLLSGIVPKRVGQTLLKEAGVTPLTVKARELTGAQRHRLNDLLREWILPVTGTLSFEQAQVTCGGAVLSQFDAATMESKCAANLFAAGEVLDADGDCGGFNLQWAWASTAAASREIAARSK